MRAREIIKETIAAKQVVDYVTHIHPASERTDALDKLILSFGQYELKNVAVDSLQIEAEEDPHGRIIMIDPDYAGELSTEHIKNKPIVIDTNGYIIDGNHRAWQAKQLGLTHIPAYVPVKKPPTEQYSIRETFDQPYPMTWEHGDDSHDVLAKLPDGTNLHIMFNEYYNDYGNEAWLVEFWRNNSLEVTGEGDAQRIFATVLSAIQQFIKKYRPDRLHFSAAKGDKQDQSRSSLYTRMVKRYANSWGYQVNMFDRDYVTVYELEAM